MPSPTCRCARSLGSLARASLALALAGSVTPLAAQYPLAPTPVLPRELFSRQVSFTGYLSARETIRDGAASFVINRARLTVHVMPVSFAALRVQADFSAVGRASGDTVPAFTLTDAYLMLFPPELKGRALRLLHPTLVAGQFRTPFSLEYLTPFPVLVTANRSQAVDRISTRRDLGLLGQVWVGHVASLTAAVVNGEGPNRTSNPDGKEMAVGRLSLFPTARLALSGKWLRQGGDHRWGSDARWVGKRLIIEGELLKQTGIAVGTAVNAVGGYVLAAYRPQAWLQLAVKWERLRERPGNGILERRLTWTTYGINLLGPQEHLRLQLGWVARAERPVEASGEFLAQIQAIF